MDNQVFNVKGEGKELLKAALHLAFEAMGEANAEGYCLDEKKGLMLYWADKSSTQRTVVPFITPLTADQLYPQVVAFLESDFANKMKLEGWDAATNDSEVGDHQGWRIYTEEWGEVDDDDYAFLAVTPSYCWYGK